MYSNASVGPFQFFCMSVHPAGQWFGCTRVPVRNESLQTVRARLKYLKKQKPKKILATESEDMLQSETQKNVLTHNRN